MAVVATVGIVVFRDEAEAIVADGCTGSAALRISAAPAIASTLKGVADDFDSWVEDRAGVPCTTTEITAASPQEVVRVGRPGPRRRRRERAHDLGPRLLAVALGAGS